MKAQHITEDTRPTQLNNLRRGTNYRATTSLGVIVGEYLGMESPHGDRALLLRNVGGTESIPLRTLTSIRNAA